MKPDRSVAEPELEETRERAPCPVVGVGASAGGLEALQGLFQHVPADLNVAQEEGQAKYDSMPRSAIDTGMVDVILPVERMGEQSAQCIRHPFLAKRKPPDIEEGMESQFQKIFVLIRSETGHDFSHYKRNTIRRRVARRLAVHQIETLDRYARFLQENPEEVKTLARELLIAVTNFFRDREAFAKLQEQVIAPLVAQKSPDSFIRVWVAGCATGEEAYSIAMMLYEETAKSGKHSTVQIFATDIDEESIETARHGQYPKSIADDVSPARLKQFFTEENNHYKVKSLVREMIVFAKHNLTKDSSFSKLDLLCCRNVLIYMDSTLQKKLIPMFHYTLNPGGFLFLGESESIGASSDLFVPVEPRHKIFRRKPVVTGYEPETEVGLPPQAKPAQTGRSQTKKGQQAIGEVAEKVILRDYSAPCVLVGEDYSIVYFNGDVNKYLIQPGGRPAFNILQMARPEIHYRLDLLLKRVFHERHMAVEKDVQVRVNGHYINADITARPITESEIGENPMLVVFQSKQREKESGAREVHPVDLPELIEQIVPQNTKFEGFKVSHSFPRIGKKVFLLNARQTTFKGEATGQILLVFEDITGRQEAGESRWKDR